MATWFAVRDAVQQALVTASGLAPERVIWSYQDTGQPLLSYIALSLGSSSPTGIYGLQPKTCPTWAPLHTYGAGDIILNSALDSYQCTIGGLSAAVGGPTGHGSAIVDNLATWAYLIPGTEISNTVLGVDEVALQLQAFTSATVASSSADDAIGILRRVIASLRLSIVRDALAAVALTPFGPGPIGYVPAIVAAGFRGRATCDVRCYLPAEAVAEYSTFIQTVTGEVDVTLGSTVHAVPFSSAGS